MADSGQPQADPQASSSSSAGKGKRHASGPADEAHLIAKRRRAIQSVAKRLSDRKLFSHALVFAVEPDGTVTSFATPSVWQEHIRNKDILKSLESAIVQNLSDKEKAALLAPFGSPPTCKAAFQSLNNNTLRMLLRAMQFDQLQCIFKQGDEESMPDHMRTQQGYYVFTGKFLDETDFGRVAENKFQGKNEKNGRFEAQSIPDHVLCQSKTMWIPGPCPHEDNPAYIIFDTVMTTSIQKMTRPMLIMAIGIHLECVNPGMSAESKQ